MKTQMQQVSSKTPVSASSGASLRPPSTGVGFVDRLAAGPPTQAKLPAAAELLRAAAGDAPHLRVPAPSGGGVPLEAGVRAAMEAAFDTSFADVRIHRDDAAESLGALAFTRGADIHFAPGAYSPGSHEGRSLLGHELTHVQQQRAGRAVAPRGDSGALLADRSLEAEADLLGERAAAGESTLVPGAAEAPPSAAGAPVQARLDQTASMLRSFGGWGALWGNIVDGLAEYYDTIEKVEQNPQRFDRRVGPANGWRMWKLKDVQENCRNWLRLHPELAESEEYTLVYQLAAEDIPSELDELQRAIRPDYFGNKVRGVIDRLEDKLTYERMARSNLSRSPRRVVRENDPGEALPLSGFTGDVDFYSRDDNDTTTNDLDLAQHLENLHPMHVLRGQISPRGGRVAEFTEMFNKSGVRYAGHDPRWITSLPYSSNYQSEESSEFKRRWR